MVLTFESGSVVTTPSAKSVAAVTRRYTIDGDDLAYEISMAAVGQPLQLHLSGHLHRVR